MPFGDNYATASLFLGRGVTLRRCALLPVHTGPIDNVHLIVDVVSVSEIVDRGLAIRQSAIIVDDDVSALRDLRIQTVQYVHRRFVHIDFVALLAHPQHPEHRPERSPSAVRISMGRTGSRLFDKNMTVEFYRVEFSTSITEHELQHAVAGR